MCHEDTKYYCTKTQPKIYVLTQLIVKKCFLKVNYVGSKIQAASLRTGIPRYMECGHDQLAYDTQEIASI